MSILLKSLMYKVRETLLLWYGHHIMWAELSVSNLGDSMSLSEL